MKKEKRYEFCLGTIMALFDPEQGQGIQWITASSIAWDIMRTYKCQ